MIDDLDAEALALALGGRIVDDDPWSVRERRKQHDEYFRAAAALQRRERRREEARQIAVIKRAEKAGLSIKRAVIDGVVVEFGQPEAKAAAAGPAVADSDFNEWDRDLGTNPPSLRQ